MKKWIDSLKNMNSIVNSNIGKYIKTHPSLKFEKERDVIFIKFSELTTKNDIEDLIEELWNNTCKFSFHDVLFPKNSDDGAFFNYSTEKTTSEDHWSMTYGNHGWSGGIYHIKKATVCLQIYHLFRKGKLDRIRISGVNFFSHYEVKSAEKSTEKDKELIIIHGERIK